MNYLTIKEVSKKWGISQALVSTLCNKGRVPGAIKPGKKWQIPENAEKPVDKRRKKKPFTFIDLFCGIGGFHQAMKSLGGECVFACDINVLCQEVYKKNFCPNNQFVVSGDIKKAIADQLIPEFDVLCGGFPCQTFSKAGNQNGFTVVEKEDGKKDERGQLFYRIIDILAQHPECKFIILENVRNLADKEENWQIVCDELKNQGFVITEKPIIESPHHFGIPQVRERVFILGIKREYLDEKKLLEDEYITRRNLHIDEKINSYSERSNCLAKILDSNVDNRYWVSDDTEELLNIWEEFRANIIGIGSPFWIHKAGIGIHNRHEYLHNKEIGYQEMPEWKQALVMKSRIMYENNYDFIDLWIERNHMLDRNLIHQKFEWNAGTDCQSLKECIIQIRQSGVRAKRPNFFPSLVVMKNTPIIWDIDAQHYRYITPKEAAKLQSFNDDFIFSETDTVSYRQLGNSINVELVKMFSEELFEMQLTNGGTHNG